MSTNPVNVACVPSQLLVKIVQGCVKSVPQLAAIGSMFTMQFTLLDAGITSHEFVLARPVSPVTPLPQGSSVLPPQGQASCRLFKAMGAATGFVMVKVKLA